MVVVGCPVGDAEGVIDGVWVGTGEVGGGVPTAVVVAVGIGGMVEVAGGIGVLVGTAVLVIVGSGVAEGMGGGAVGTTGYTRR
jgi:hypothetical protein